MSNVSFKGVAKNVVLVGKQRGPCLQLFADNTVGAFGAQQGTVVSVSFLLNETSYKKWIFSVMLAGMNNLIM